MKKTLAVMLIFCSNYVYSLDFGVGASIDSDLYSIYFPIKGRGFIFEPYVWFWERDSRSDYTENDSRYTKSTNVILGAGLFYNHRFNENVDTYIGSRFSRIDEKYKSRDRNDGEDDSSYGYTVKGYQVIPTVGFSYLFLEKLGVTVEAGIVYQDTKFKDDNGIEESTKVTNTDASIIVRYYF